MDLEHAQAFVATLLPQDAMLHANEQRAGDSVQAAYCSPALAVAFPSSTMIDRAPMRSDGGLVMVTNSVRADGFVDWIAASALRA